METQEAPLIEAIFRELIDERRGVLCQGLDTNGRKVPFCSQFDNALALLLGLVPEAMVERFHRFCAGPSGTWPTNRSAWQGGSIGEEIRSRPDEMVVAGTPFGSYIAARAIAVHESPQAAIDYLRYNFGAMVDEGPGTLWEVWPLTAAKINSTCASQGCGTSVALLIHEIGLGLRLAAPGGTTLEWAPRRVSFRQMSGIVRTKSGDATVGWSGDRLFWQVPEGVVLNITSPGGGRETVHGPAIEGV